jgi:hypothetical protein
VCWFGAGVVVGRADRAHRTARAGAVSDLEGPIGAVDPAGKLACVIAGMAAGADCIDELDVIRAGGMTSLLDGVYAAATLGHRRRLDQDLAPPPCQARSNRHDLAHSAHRLVLHLLRNWPWPPALDELFTHAFDDPVPAAA